MSQIMKGVRILELASWVYIPAASGVLADWGADVIKIEHPTAGDPGRGLVVGGLTPDKAKVPVSLMYEHPNRGKRSVGLDLKTQAGREILYRLAATSDVLLTNWRTSARRRAGVDVEQIRAVNPRIIYVRGSGQGVKGPDSELGGFDSASYWARGGLAYVLTPMERTMPIAQRPGIGDLAGGIITAGGIAAALYHRERTGEALIVDTSLLGVATWILSPDMLAADLYGVDKIPGLGSPEPSPNPIAANYQTKDNRFICLSMLESDRYWADFCSKVGRPELGTDPRFIDSTARTQNKGACSTILTELFLSKGLAEWKQILAGIDGVWSVFQSPLDMLSDPQVLANGYTPEVELPDGGKFRTTNAPIQFNETPAQPRRAPQFCEHTEEVLLEAGFSWEEIGHAREAGVIG